MRKVRNDRRRARGEEPQPDFILSDRIVAAKFYGGGMLPSNVTTVSFSDSKPRHRNDNKKLPTTVQFALILMSRTRRNDVLNDIMDWYPGWVAEKGRFAAHVACWWRIGLAGLGGLLDLIQRMGEIVGKFRGAR